MRVGHWFKGSGSVKGTFVESSNARKVIQVHMVNPFQLSMETQGFPLAKLLAPFHGTGPAV